jgi:ABC-type uncharacterized transport system substrate-binding protein
VKLQVLGLDRPADADNTFSALTKDPPNGLLIFRSPIIRMLATRITEFADRNRLPTMYADSQFVEGGGLMSYAADLLALDRHTAVYVDKILKGAKPGDRPVEGTKKFELVVNVKTAQKIGLTISTIDSESGGQGDQGCAGINRHGVADERAAQERSSAPSWLRVMRLGPQGRG